MLEANELVALSDIHLGPEYGKGLFRADKELVNCLNWILDNKKNCYVVLAGDIFDFLVLGKNEKPSDFYNLDKVEERMTKIIDHHPDVFKSLAKLANSSDHQLLFIGGNHDPEVVFPEVQLLIEKKLGSSSHPIVRWTVHGESLSIKVGAAKVLIEHGNLFDRFNKVDHNALREVLSIKNRGFSLDGRSYYKPPFGSKLVIDYVNPIRGEFPWLDYLHVGREGSYLLWRELTTIKQKGSFLPALRGAILAVSYDEFTKLRSKLNPAKKYKADNEDKLLNWINKQLSKQNDSKTKGVFFKVDDSELLQELISAWEDVSDISLPDSAYKDVQFILGNGADLVIHGHTHQAKIYPIDKGLYINTGTWGQLLELPHKDDSNEEWETFINNLRTGSNWKDTSLSRATFANVSFDTNTKETTASLIEWENDAPKYLSSWTFTDLSNNWQEKK